MITTRLWLKEIWEGMVARLRGRGRGLEAEACAEGKPCDGKCMEAAQKRKVDRLAERLERESVEMRVTLSLLSDRSGNIQRKVRK